MEVPVLCRWQGWLSGREAGDPFRVRRPAPMGGHGRAQSQGGTRVGPLLPWIGGAGGAVRRGH
eukprot:11047335-Prorocentrum_lima.AAC.1